MTDLLKASLTAIYASTRQSQLTYAGWIASAIYCGRDEDWGKRLDVLDPK